MGCSFLVDPEPYAGQGPLAGLLAGLSACKTDWLFLVPIDAPFFPPQAALAALEAVYARQLSDVKAIGFLDEDGRRQWLPGLYHHGLGQILQQALESGVRSLGAFIERVPYYFWVCNLPQLELKKAFSNLNTVEIAEQAGFYFPS